MIGILGNYISAFTVVKCIFINVQDTIWFNHKIKMNFS